MAQKYFLSQYLFIAIFCVKMSRVNKALIRTSNLWDLLNNETNRVGSLETNFFTPCFKKKGNKQTQ